MDLAIFCDSLSAMGPPYVSVTEKMVQVKIVWPDEKMVWPDHSWLTKNGPARAILVTKSGLP